MNSDESGNLAHQVLSEFMGEGVGGVRDFCVATLVFHFVKVC